mgnify:CR=1 FL=1
MSRGRRRVAYGQADRARVGSRKYESHVPYPTGPHHCSFATRWSGHLEGIAIYTRALGPQEVEQECAAFTEKIKARKPVPRIELQAKLRKKSKVPKYEEIAPYAQAVAFYEYEVERVLSGKCEAKKIRVAHYGMIDRKPLVIKDAEPGKSCTLALEPYEANPQLSSDYPSDELPPDPAAALYYDVGPLKGPAR